jgi:hypothetical protein
MITLDLPSDVYSQTDYVAIVERAEFFHLQVEPAPSLMVKVNYFSEIPQDFIEAMNDFNSGNVVDLDVALNQKPSNEA